MILVTGATGLVGAHLVLALLQKGEKVRATYRTLSAIEKTEKLFQTLNHSDLFKNLEWMEAEITNIPALEIAFKEIDYVYHCAAVISFDDSDAEMMYKINTEGTANVVNLCLYYGIKKLCYVSSIAALGHHKKESEFINEETEWNPELVDDDYSLTKYGAEIEVQRGIQEGLNAVIVNPGIILGAGFWNRTSGKLFPTVNKGLPFYTQGVCGYVDVEDVVKAMILLMEKEVSGERFCLVSENLSYQEILNHVAQVLNKPQPKYYAPFWLTHLLYFITGFLTFVGLKKRYFTKSMSIHAHSKTYYDSSKIKKELDFTFKSIAQSIQEIGLVFKSEA
mgnify:FL=1